MLALAWGMRAKLKQNNSKQLGGIIRFTLALSLSHSVNHASVCEV